MELETCFARNRASWRSWLGKNHASSPGVWLVLYKKPSGKPSVTYAEALDEALCFGWIDSIVKRIDDASYARKFTQRTNPKNWSDTNLRHMKRLIAEKRMTEAGLRVLGVPLGKSDSHRNVANMPAETGAKEQEEIPEFIRDAVLQNRKAAEFWGKLASGYRRRYVAWILNAKAEKTRMRRLAEVVGYLAAGTKAVLK
jgi:uncharacterized protein YdeI (YjbR/CyaY-like superfamily)